MSEFDPATEKIIELYSQWLNTHHRANDEDVVVKREDYDEYDDAPRVLSDVRTDYYRIVTLSLTPYHDGHATLVAFVTEHRVHAIVQEFDTNVHMIYEDGEFVSASLPRS